MAQRNSGPMAEFRAKDKKSLKIVVWERDDGSRSYTLSKSYKKEGEWVEVKIQFYADELPHVEEVVTAAREYESAEGGSEPTSKGFEG